MNKKVVIGIIAAFVIVVGLAGAWYVMNMNKTQSAVSEELTEAVNQNQESTESKANSGSWSDLLASSVSQKCTVKYANEGVSSEGTVYVGGGRMRGDVSMTIEGKPQTFHMIVMDNKMNYWMDNQKQGFTMTWSGAVPTATPQTAAAKQQFDLNQKVDYKCGAWAADSKMFEVPSDVTFQDLSSLMKKVVPSSGSGETNVSANCGVCANLSGEQKTQCLTALNCN